MTQDVTTSRVCQRGHAVSAGVETCPECGAGVVATSGRTLPPPAPSAGRAAPGRLSRWLAGPLTGSHVFAAVGLLGLVVVLTVAVYGWRHPAPESLEYKSGYDTGWTLQDQGSFNEGDICAVAHARKSVDFGITPTPRMLDEWSAGCQDGWRDSQR